ncbi:MAG TPA: hypothetical protein VLF88_01765 [Candidatus Babeliales bacterium]|nr:hypothetical protein [Candidatus Babeliales bacterium]
MNPVNQQDSQAAGPNAQANSGGMNQTAPGVVPPQSTAAPASPNSTQNTLLISEVRDGIVIMSDGSFRAVVMCKSINFDLMSPQEREAVEFSYQGFLNSLYFPVQIFIRSQKVDLRPYLEKLDKIRGEHDNMLLGLLMEDYIAFLADIAQQTNIMDKKFYVVIKYPDTDQDIRKALKQSTSFFTGLAGLFKPSNPSQVVVDESTLETAKTQLRNRVQAVMQGLAQAGVQSLPLDTEELIELYYDAYNPDTATRQQIKNFEEVSSPVITKGEGSAPNQLTMETS